MLRHRAFVLLTLIHITIQISAEQTIYSDGWIPMSQNDIYEQIRRGTSEYPVYFSKRTQDNSDDLNIEQKIVTKNENEYKDTAAIFMENEPDNIKTNKLGHTVYTKENTRKAKKVWEPNVDTSIDNVLVLPEVDSKTDVSTEKTVDVITAATSNTYEVTEPIDTSPAEDSYTTESAGYQYNPPTDENQNLTFTFYRILSKYNIKTGDKLPNYELSLQRKVQNPSRGTNRALVPYRYNSLNHLPADPLLAVFLSNYGFYLPTLYGIKANYNNLYGYLASNNIHNNKPFGLYKVFSDTDSWN